MGWKRILSQKRPAAGGEAHELLSYRELQPAEWNCEQDANIYRVWQNCEHKAEGIRIRK